MFKAKEIIPALKSLFDLKAEARDRAVGIFVSHVKSERVENHFARLKRESGLLMDWYFLKTTNTTGSIAELSLGRPDRTMLRRHAEMMENGGYQGGFLDTIIIPAVIATGAQSVWIMEYDVDFSGNWHDFFVQFRDTPADLLTTTIFPKDDNPDWFYWRTATAPPDVPLGTYHRSFHPIMRISRSLATDYARRMEEGGWGGHYEFTLPTSAMSGNFLVEDLGGSGPFCPDIRQGRNYANTHTDRHLQPGTFAWRPSRPAYFHESADGFHRENFLYHPIKPDVADWGEP